VDIDHGQLVYPSLNRFAVVMSLANRGDVQDVPAAGE
jgi:hypothetical protein